MLIATIIFIYFPKNIITLSVNINPLSNNTLIDHATLFLFMTGILQLSENFRLITTGALRALKDTKISMYINLITFWLIAFPSVYLLAFTFNVGAIGVWLGLIVGLSIGALTLMLRFKYTLKYISLERLITR